MEKTNRKIGIMGGTFDPIHIGHLILGEAAYEQFGLDEVWFLPAGNPPHKRNRAGQAKDAQRVEMVRRAIASNPHFVLCTKEMKDEGYTYSYRTLEAMRKEHPGTEFYFIIGADSLFYFDEWKIQSGSAPRQRSLWRPGIGQRRKSFWPVWNEMQKTSRYLSETRHTESGCFFPRTAGMDPGRKIREILSAGFCDFLHSGAENLSGLEEEQDGTVRFMETGQKTPEGSR